MKRKRKKRKALEIASIEEINPWNVDLLKRYMTGDGTSARLVSRFVSLLPAKFHRRLRWAVSVARQLNLV